MAQPAFGDEVIVTALPPTGFLYTVSGILAPELDGSGNLVGLVVETDGGAAYIAPKTVIKIERI